MLFLLGYSEHSINKNNLEYNLVINLLGYSIVSLDCVDVESTINCIIMVNTLGWLGALLLVKCCCWLSGLSGSWRTEY